jgi:T5orf172 domain
MDEAYEAGFESWQIPDQTCVGRWIIGGVGKTNRFTRHLCGKPAVTIIAGAALCERHEQWALEWHREESAAELRRSRDEAQRTEAYRQMKLRWEEEARRADMAGSWVANGHAVVYYVRRASDGCIKIGTSTRLQGRLDSLRRKKDPVQLLLTHRGDHERERRIHKIFDDLAIGGEWFRPGETLLCWILETRRRPINIKSAYPETIPIAEVEALAEEARRLAAIGGTA